jgi:hypothetical protein
MTDTRSGLAALLPELHETQRRATPEPALEEILAYLNGEMSEKEAEDLRQRLSYHPQATRLLLDLADPSRLADPADVDLPLPDPADLERRLRAVGLFDRQAPVVPIRPGVHPLYRWATAALILLSVGLGIRLGSDRGTVADTDVAIWELLPRAESEERGRGETVEATPGFSHDLLLYSNDVRARIPYRIVVVDAGAEVVLTREVRSLRAGRVVLRLSSRDLGPGRYEVRLFAAEASDSAVAVYPLEWIEP